MPRVGKNYRRWCYTLNNYTPTDEQRLQAIEAGYHIYGREVSASGTPHLQGYITFENAKSLDTMRALMPRAHLEQARGTGEENETYCSKQDPNPFRRGTFSTQGKRTDLDSLLSSIKSGATYTQIIEDHPTEYFKYHQAIDKAISHYLPERNWVMEVIWAWGPTGTGKSHFADSISTPENTYRKFPGKWWDGYSGQETVIFDEFRADWMPFYHLLLLFDKYPLKVETKGGTRNFCSKRIVITTPLRWDDTFRSQTEEKLNQLERRITETRHFPFRYVTPELAKKQTLDLIHNWHDGDEESTDTAIELCTDFVRQTSFP